MNDASHPLIFDDVGIFLWKSANFAISKKADIDCNLVYNFFYF